MVNKLRLATGIVFALASARSSIEYFSKSDTSEIDLLRGVSAYVQQYDGENPSDVLSYVKDTLEIVSEGNLQIPEISDLEKEVSIVNKQIRDSAKPYAHESVLRSVGEHIETVADKYGRNQSDLLVGVLSGVSSLFMFLNPYTWRRRED